MQQLERAAVRGWPDLMVAAEKSRLLKAVGKAQRRGELGAVGPLVSGGHGIWYVRVLRIKAAPKRRPVWPWVAGGTVAVLTMAAAAGWWLASAVSILLPGSALLTVALMVGRWLTSPGCTITHVRH